MLERTKVNFDKGCDTCCNQYICKQVNGVAENVENIMKQYDGASEAIYINIYCPYYKENK